MSIKQTSFRELVITNLDLTILALLILYLSTQYVISGNFLSQLVLIAFVALFVEKLYVGRANVIQNVSVIGFIVWSSWDKLPNFLQYYLILGLVIGAIGAILYLKRGSWRVPPVLKRGFNAVAYAFFSMKTLSGLFVSISLIGFNFDWPFWIVAVLTSLSVWSVSIRLLGHDSPLNFTD